MPGKNLLYIAIKPLIEYEYNTNEREINYDESVQRRTYGDVGRLRHMLVAAFFTLRAFHPEGKYVLSCFS